MRLKVAKSKVITRPLEIRDGFSVMVRSKTRRQLEELFDRCSTQKLNSSTGRMEPILDEKMWAEHAPDAYIAGWEGLTPSIIRQLGIPLEEDPPTNGDGYISYDAELARDLWRHAYADRFAQPISQFARELLTLVEAEKKIVLTPAAASSES